MNDKHELARKILESGFGGILHEIVFEGVAGIVKLADEKREPIADAAEFLHCDHGFTANWLRHHEAISITRYAGDLRTMSRERVAMMCIFEPVIFQADRLGVVINGELYEPSGNGWSFRLKYPDREKLANSAQYLWKNQKSGDLASLLRRETPDYILDIAFGRQQYLCSKVADAAWVCVDSGFWKAHHFFSPTVSDGRILEAAEAIKERQSRSEANPRDLLGVLKIEGQGEHGQRVKVEGIAVLEKFALDPESEFIKATAKAYGITSVTGASFSSGPGIYS